MPLTINAVRPPLSPPTPSMRRPQPPAGFALTGRLATPPPGARPSQPLPPPGDSSTTQLITKVGLEYYAQTPLDIRLDPLIIRSPRSAARSVAVRQWVW
ncbi:hypothetical protein FRACA_10054 [Frankia canadensis]|uniref:Uncharacterized protein n=1 Tax=Frankia canadensis TaxID=1836972 RepID=A0A2I2KHZ8_9ACTN|nr:hypothetical protein FRACA_10054 [Frankia canadensis]SOU52585.1 hypothetical protein FRACA_10054 [Frankia canadensis]